MPEPGAADVPAPPAADVPAPPAATPPNAAAGGSPAMPSLIVVAGATATGKTGLGIELAEAYLREGRHAVVISADSRQVYRGLDIGTAKVGAADRTRVPHAGLDLVEPSERFALADFVRHAEAVLTEVAARDGVAFLVGGTGLYLRAVARGIDPDALPDDPAARARIETDLAEHGLPALADRLRDVAPILAGGTDLANPRRVVRALEIAELRGDGPRPEPRGYPGPATWLGLRLDPAEHARRIEARARQQFTHGLVEEAVLLRERFDPGLPAFTAIGYHEAWEVADGIRTLDEAVDLDAQRNIAFAKRQRTWFRAEPDIDWLDAARDDLTKEALQRVRRVIPA